jgi:hypothetical protein
MALGSRGNIHRGERKRSEQTDSHIHNSAIDILEGERNLCPAVSGAIVRFTFSEVSLVNGLFLG